MFDKEGLAEEVSAAINGSASGEVRIRWTTLDSQQTVEVVRSGTWVSDAPLSLWDLAETGPTGPTQIGSETSRAERRASDVRKIVDLIEVFGVGAVKLDAVQALLGLAKTSAYHRLTEARELWGQEASA